MMKTSEVVAGIVARSLEASIMLQKGCLNLSAYAKLIQQEVEIMTKKEVKLGSIVIALSRLGKTQKQQSGLLPTPNVIEVSARSGLMEIVYERTQRNLELFHLVQKEIATSQATYFMATQGIAEITLIAPEEKLPKIQEFFRGITPKSTIRNLSGLTLRTTEEVIYTPNVFFSILYPFAMARINVLEIISTYTEITMIFEDKDLQEGFEILKRFLKR